MLCNYCTTNSETHSKPWFFFDASRFRYFFAINHLCCAIFDGYSALRQGLRIEGRRTPPGPEGSNGSPTFLVVALWRLFFTARERSLSSSAPVMPVFSDAQPESDFVFGVAWEIL